MQVVEERTPETRIKAFIEPKTSCPSDIKRLAESLAKSYKVPVHEIENYKEDEEQIVVITMNTRGYPEFLKKLVTNGGKGIKALFIEQYSHNLPEHFEQVFEKNIIDLSDDGVLPEGIIRDELSLEIERKISQVLKRKNREKAEDQIEYILKLKLEEKKPRKRVLSPARKFLLKEKLSQYGTLEEVFKALQE